MSSLSLKLECVLFDIDGVLVATSRLMLDAYREAIETASGQKAADAELKEVLGLSPKSALMLFNPALASSMCRIYDRHFREHYAEKIVPVLGLNEVLNKLASEIGATFGAVTSRNKMTAQYALRASGLSKWIATLITWGDTSRHKPDPAPILLALERLAINAERAAYVGDRVEDIQAGREAGVLTIAATWCDTADHERLRAEKPDYVIATSEELYGVVAGRQI